MNKNQIIAIIVMLLFGTVGLGIYHMQETEVAGAPLRLHVIANSDSVYDQEVKFQVRDEILNLLSDVMKDAASKEEAMKDIRMVLPQIEEECNAVLKNYTTYTASASLEKADFPTRRYGDLVLPAGNYDALRIVLGDGDGHNWWCVLFPPLCFVDATGNFSNQTVSTTAESVPVTAGTVQIKLKIKELFGK